MEYQYQTKDHGNNATKQKQKRMKTIMKTLMMFTIIGAIMFAGVSLGSKAPPEKAKTEIVKESPAQSTDVVTDTAVAPTVAEPPGITSEPQTQPSNFEKWLEKIYMFLGSVIGITVLRFLLRYIPTAGNVDIVGWIVKIINLIYGAWIENKKVGGGTFKRNYSK